MLIVNEEVESITLTASGGPFREWPAERWAQALAALDAKALEQGVVDETLGVLLKYQDDIQKVQGSEAKKLLDEVKKGLVFA